MQKYIAVGRLTREPVLTYTESGIAKCIFVIAVDSRKGSFKRTDFIPCVAWRGLAEVIPNFTSKGHRVGIQGLWRSNTYEKNGEKQVRFEVEVDDCEFYDSPQQN
ncbi:single-stranded DNA-binding protein (plasmid) [Sporosarcina psychrophila]|uniref:single-stranded DNA-binding protein n=1 Tax=Sporosarcina psychrophila TaxID=1476 RepID=UPI0030CD6178